MRILLVILLCLSTMVGCKEPDRRQIRAVKVQKETKNINLVYNVHGVIIEKFPPNQYSSRYYFIIKLSDENVFEWEVSRAQYTQKEVGSPVRFDYLAKERYSKKAR